MLDCDKGWKYESQPEKLITVRAVTSRGQDHVFTVCSVDRPVTYLFLDETGHRFRWAKYTPSLAHWLTDKEGLLFRLGLFRTNKVTLVDIFYNRFSRVGHYCTSKLMWKTMLPHIHQRSPRHRTVSKIVIALAFSIPVGAGKSIGAAGVNSWLLAGAF